MSADAGDVELVIGIVGVAVAWVLPCGQWWRARRHKAGISPLAWALFVVVDMGWASYGVGTGNWFLVLNGSGALAFDVGVLGRIRTAPRYWAVAVVGAAGVAGLGVAFGWAATIASVGGIALALRIPQLVAIARSGAAAGVTRIGWGVNAANNALWAVIGVVRGDAWLVGINVALALASLAVVVLAIHAERRGVRRA